MKWKFWVSGCVCGHEELLHFVRKSVPRCASGVTVEGRYELCPCAGYARK